MPKKIGKMKRMHPPTLLCWIAVRSIRQFHFLTTNLIPRIILCMVWCTHVWVSAWSSSGQGSNGTYSEGPQKFTSGIWHTSRAQTVKTTALKAHDTRWKHGRIYVCANCHHAIGTAQARRPFQLPGVCFFCWHHDKFDYIFLNHVTWKVLVYASITQFASSLHAMTHFVQMLTRIHKIVVFTYAKGRDYKALTEKVCNEVYRCVNRCGFHRKTILLCAR